MIDDKAINAINFQILTELINNKNIQSINEVMNIITNTPISSYDEYTRSLLIEYFKAAKILKDRYLLQMADMLSFTNKRNEAIGIYNQILLNENDYENNYYKSNIYTQCWLNLCVCLLKENKKQETEKVFNIIKEKIEKNEFNQNLNYFVYQVNKSLNNLAYNTTNDIITNGNVIDSYDYVKHSPDNSKRTLMSMLSPFGGFKPTGKPKRHTRGSTMIRNSQINNSNANYSNKSTVIPTSETIGNKIVENDSLDNSNHIDKELAYENNNKFDNNDVNVQRYNEYLISENSNRSYHNAVEFKDDDKYHCIIDSDSNDDKPQLPHLLSKHNSKYSKKSDDLISSSDNSSTYSMNSIDIKPKTKSKSYYPYEILKHKHLCPLDVDLTHRELHLSPDEFYYIFHVSIADWKNIPLWKQINLRKKFGLF